jgi:predicted anti-sigma-YlaC factor YlaD
MTCDTATLSRYLDSELTLPQRVDFEAHLAGCQPCRELLDEFQRLDVVLRDWGASREPIPLETERRIQASTVRRSRSRSILSAGRVMPAAVGTTMAALLVLTTVNLSSLIPSHQGANANAGPPRKVLIAQSAPLVQARRVSAISGGRPLQRASTSARSHFGIEPE